MTRGHQFDPAPPPVARCDSRLSKNQVLDRIDEMKEQLAAAAERSPFSRMNVKQRNVYRPIVATPNEPQFDPPQDESDDDPVEDF